MSAKSHMETLIEKYTKMIIEYEVSRVAAKAEIRRAERAGDENEAERQRLEMQRFVDLGQLCIAVAEDLKRFAVENTKIFESS